MGCAFLLGGLFAVETAGAFPEGSAVEGECDKGHLADLAVAELIEKQEDGYVSIDERFVPIVKDLSVSQTAVAQLAELLGHDNQFVRAKAARTLGDFEGEAAEAVDALIGALGDAELSVRRDAARALGNIGPKMPQAVRAKVVSALVKALDDDKKPRFRQSVAETAASALARFGPEARVAVPKLLEKLKAREKPRYGNGDAAYSYLRAIDSIGSDEELDTRPLIDIAAASDEDAALRRAALRALSGIPKAAGEAVEPLSEILNNAKENDGIRAAAGLALAALRPRTNGLASSLESMMRDDNVDPTARVLSAKGYWQVSQRAQPVLATLTPLTRHRNSEVRKAAIRAIGEMKAAAKPAIPELVAALDPPEEPNNPFAIFSEPAAIDALAAIGPDAVKPLRKTLHNDTTRAHNAALVLARMKDAGTNILLEAVKSDRAAVRQAAVGGLAEVEAKSEDVKKAILSALKDENENVRSAGASGLKAVEPDAQVVELLKRALKDEKASVRKAAAYSLKSIGFAEPAAVKALAEAVRVRDADVRKVGVSALTQFGRLSACVQPEVRAALHNADPEIRIAAVRILAVHPETGTAKQALRNALDDEELSVRLQAARLLPKTDYPEKGLDVLIESLQHDKAEIRATAASALVRLSSRARKALPAIKKATSDADRLVRTSAYHALESIEGTFIGLAAALKDPDAGVRWEAANRVAEEIRRDENAEDVEEVVPGLTSALEDARRVNVKKADVIRSYSVREEAAKALTEIGPRAKQAVPALIEAVKKRDQGDQDFRFQAIAALAQIGPDAKQAVPVLTDVVRENRKGFSWRAAAALGQIGEPSADAVPALVEALREGKEIDLRVSAARALGRIGKTAASKSMGPLTAALEASPVAVRLAAAESLIQLGESSRAVPVIAAMLKHENAFRRRDAARALAKAGARAQSAIPALERALEDEESYVRMAVAEAVWKIDRRADLAVPVFVNQLKTAKNRFDRADAARFLGEMGPEAKDAIPALERALNDEEYTVRAAASAALEKIRNRSENG